MNSHTRWTIVVGAAAVILIAASFYIYERNVAQKTREVSGDTAIGGETRTLIIKNARIDVSVADSPEELTLGLGGRTSLRANEGMWFVFGESGKHGIWMKDMKIPIDVVWFDAERRVVSIQTHMTPESYPQVFFPDTDAAYVLEVNAGFVENSGLSVGDIAVFE